MNLDNHSTHSDIKFMDDDESNAPSITPSGPGASRRSVSRSSLHETESTCASQSPERKDSDQVNVGFELPYFSPDYSIEKKDGPNDSAIDASYVLDLNSTRSISSSSSSDDSKFKKNSGVTDSQPSKIGKNPYLQLENSPSPPNVDLTPPSPLITPNAPIDMQQDNKDNQQFPLDWIHPELAVNVKNHPAPVCDPKQTEPLANSLHAPALSSANLEIPSLSRKASSTGSTARELESLYGDGANMGSKKSEGSVVAPNFVDLVQPEVDKKMAVFGWGKSVGKALKTNALYESTELGGFKYLTMTTSPCELIFWYCLLAVFVIACVIHVEMTLADLYEEEIKTNQLLGSAVDEDYQNIRNWTLCFENYFGGARPNEPVYDALFVAKMAKAKVPGSTAAVLDQSTMMFFIQLFNNALHIRGQSTDDPKPSILDTFLSIIKQFYSFENKFGYGFRHSLLLRKHLQQLYQQEMPGVTYGRKSMARYDAFEFTDDFAKLQGYGDDHSATLLYPGGFLINQLNYDLLDSTSIYKTRLEELQSLIKLNDSELRLPELDSFNYTELFTNKRMDRNLTDAFYNVLSVNRNKKAFFEYVKASGNEFSTDQKLRAIDQLRQLALADIQTSKEYAAQKEIAAEDMQLAKQMYQTFNKLMLDNGVTAAIPAQQLAEVYVSLFITPTLDIYTEPVQKSKDVKITLRFLDETLECFNVELPEDTQLTRVQTKLATFLALMGDDEKTLFNDPEFTAKYRRHYANRFASWWMEPAIFEPVTTPNLRMYFNEDSAMHLKVENKFELLNTSHSQCEADEAKVAFDCFTECRRDFIKLNLQCTPNLYRNAQEIGDGNG